MTVPASERGYSSRPRELYPRAARRGARASCSRPARKRRAGNLGGWGHALFAESTPLEAFSRLNVPVRYMTGSDSPASSLGVARLLTRTLPRVQVVRFEGLGHMGPVTHPEVVNEAIRAFLGAGRS